MGASAIFLDRDGTIMTDVHYPSDPEQVVLIEGAAAAIARANSAQIPVVIVTNQSGIGRGLLSEAQYHAVHARLTALLRANGAVVHGSYYCPHWPERDGPCDCRKPGIGMHTRAARDLQLTLSESVYVGDRFRDVEPALVTGGLGLLVPGANTPAIDIERARATALADLSDAPAPGHHHDVRVARDVRVAPTITVAIDVALQWIHQRAGAVEHPSV